MPSNRVAIPAKVKRAVRERDGNRCQICKKKFDPVFLDYDHIYPYSLGGSNDVDNLRQVCKKCNSVKRDKVHCGDCGELNKPTADYCQKCGARQRHAPSGGGWSLRRLAGTILLFIALVMLAQQC